MNMVAGGGFLDERGRGIVFDFWGKEYLRVHILYIHLVLCWFIFEMFSLRIFPLKNSQREKKWQSQTRANFRI